MTRKRRKLRKGRAALVIGLVAVIGLASAYGIKAAITQYFPALLEVGNESRTAKVNPVSHAQDIAAILDKNALDQVSVSGFSDEELRKCFVSYEIDDKIRERLAKIGWSEDKIPLSSLRYVRVLYRNFDNKPTVGELVVNADMAQATEDVFFDLFNHKYQIGKMILQDAYGGSLSDSYADNNTIALAFGLTDGNSSDVHEQGYAIDLNPLYNPLVKDNGSSVSVFPMQGQLYLDRTLNGEHYISASDYAVEAFGNHGFSWGGDKKGLNDYKHFEFINRPTPATSETSHSEQASEQQQSAEPEQTPVEEPVVPEEPVYEEPVYEDPGYEEWNDEEWNDEGTDEWTDPGTGEDWTGEETYPEEYTE